MPPKRSTSTKRSAPASGKDVKAEKPAKAAKKSESATNGKSEQAASTASPSNKQIFEWLLSDEAWTLAYPPIPAGKGEVDLPTGSQIKPPPKRPSSTEKSSAKKKTSANITLNSCF